MTTARPLLWSLTLLLLSGVGVEAADIASPSRVDAVTVFPQGAEITRASKVRIPVGEHVLIFAELPASAIPNSIRVEGKASGTLAIGSVDSRRLPVSREEREVGAAERRQIEQQIERLQDDRTALAGQITAAEAQKRLIGNLADLPGKPVPAGSAPPAMPDWTALVALIGDRTLAIEKSILDTNVKVREIERRISDLQKKLEPIAPAVGSRTEVKVFVTAATALEADMIVRYQVAAAAWTPHYDARLTTGTRTTGPKLQLVRRAAIQQRTGEPWNDVALSLSTTRPSQGSQAPELTPTLVDAQDPPPPAPPRPQARAAMESADVMATRRPMAMPASSAPPEEARKDAAPINATIDANAFQALYGIQGRVTIAETGEAKRVQIDQSDIDPTLTIRTVPKRDAKAFLYAKLATPRTTAILPGQVSLFRDGTFVGTGRLPQLAAGEDHELGFGQDDNVRVRYAVAEEKRSESGIITTSKTEAKSYKISVQSLHERPIAVSVIDQQPVSVSQDVKVEFTAKPAPSRRDMEDKRGLVAWDFSLNPNEERVVEFSQRVTWPAAKQLIMR